VTADDKILYFHEKDIKNKNTIFHFVRPINLILYFLKYNRVQNCRPKNHFKN